MSSSHRRPSNSAVRRIHAKTRAVGFRIPPRLLQPPLSATPQFALLSAGYGRLLSNQIEAARKAIRRRVRREGVLRTLVAAISPFTSKPLQSRMGKGKGRISGRFCSVRPGQFLFLLTGSSPLRAIRALRGGGMKLPLSVRISPLHPLLK